ncbi:hypothetical protein ABL78_4737 [Leptomonas seymouri]|uniref:Transferase family protein n=1 Tax=Leptomonas seymouri TaxID=5684 RepID=A0A0N1IKF3_LEPSE|nr:hypothetical protein ABL78_4737 [Leptomonas seymouri]|eukprot:KPI86184.1 hypothetical protein ABL78_4737 [Leptomonas seymouri]
MPQHPTVLVRRTVEVRCAHTDKDFPIEPFPLGPIEGLIAPAIPIAVSFVYRYSGQMEASLFVSTDLLQQAMSCLLNFYPPLSGRLGLLPNGDREINRLNSGAHFVEATCDLSLRELHEARTGGGERADARFQDVLSMFDLPAGSNALFAPFSPAADRIVNDPLFTIQHTRFACGSVALGVRISHALTDAQGFFQVVRHLMELYGQLRGGEANPTLQKPPQWRPYASTFRAEATPAVVAEALSYQPVAWRVEEPPTQAKATEDGTPAVTVPRPPPSPPSLEVVGRELYFSAEQLRELKRRATSPDGKGWASTFEALSAFLWQCVYVARCAVYLRESCTTDDPLRWPIADFLTSINLRDRFLRAPEGDAADYFPVGCFPISTKMSPRVLRDGPLHQLAAVVHALLRASELDPTEVQRTVRWMAAQPDRARIRSHFTQGGFMISAWNKLDLYGAAACEGVQPLLVSTPFTCISLVDTLGYILPYPPAFTDTAASPAAADAGNVERCQSAEGDGVVVYMAVDALLWDALSSQELLGKYVH